MANMLLLSVIPLVGGDGSMTEIMAKQAYFYRIK